MYYPGYYPNTNIFMQNPYFFMPGQQYIPPQQQQQFYPPQQQQPYYPPQQPQQQFALPQLAPQYQLPPAPVPNPASTSLAERDISHVVLDRTEEVREPEGEVYLASVVERVDTAVIKEEEAVIKKEVQDGKRVREEEEILPERAAKRRRTIDFVKIETLEEDLSLEPILNQAHALLTLSKHAEALKGYLQAIKIEDFTTFCNEETIGDVYFNIGLCYKEQPDFENAVKYFKKSCRFYKKAKTPTSLEAVVGTRELIKQLLDMIGKK